MSEQNSIKNRVMSNVHRLLQREPQDETTPEATQGEEPNVVEPGDAPTALHSPRAFTGSPDMRASRYSNAVITVESHRFLPIIMVLCVLIGLSIMGTAWAISMAFRAQERADLLQLEVESFKNVLHKHGLPTAAHLEGESP
jgi:hypothetical protein